MAKYNAAKHRIESADGRLLATLTEHVETAKAWEIADWWGGDAVVVENLESEITNADFNLAKARECEDYARRELDKVEDELATAKLQIEGLEQLIGEKRGPLGNVLAAVILELGRATRKFPSWPTDPLHACGVIDEEIGVLKKEILMLTYEPRKSSKEAVKAEATQTAAMSLRFMISLDQYKYKAAHQHVQTEVGKAGCAACDRDDYQLGHADECSKKGAPDA